MARKAPVASAHQHLVKPKKTRAVKPPHPAKKVKAAHPGAHLKATKVVRTPKPKKSKAPKTITVYTERGASQWHA